MKNTPTVLDDFPAWIQRSIAELSDVRRGTFVRFLRELRLRGASRYTIANYVKAVRTLGNDGKSYEELTSEDLMVWMERIDSNGWSQSTVDTIRKQVKAFLRRLHGCRLSTDPTPEFLKCIQVRKSRQELPKNILARAEIRRLIDAAEKQRDRALVYVGYESGARAGEILGLKIGDVEFDEYGSTIRVQGKTGSRRLRLVESTPDLRLWISMHSRGDDSKAPLWIGKRGTLGIDGFQYVLEKLGREAKIGKHIHPHLLRHSRATHLAGGILTESQMRTHFGWAKSSRMPEVYVHLSGRDVDSTLLKHYGIKVEPPTENLLGPKMCPWCKTINSTAARYCQQCNAPLDPVSANKAAERQKRRTELVERFIERILQEIPEASENILREMRRELEALT
jgi:site-specific recombinase XerC